MNNLNLEDDGSLGRPPDDILRLIDERVEPSDDLQQLVEHVELLYDAHRALDDDVASAQGGAANVASDLEDAVGHEGNIQARLATPNLTLNDREQLRAQLNDAMARTERVRKRKATADEKVMVAIARRGNARVAYKNVSNDLWRRLTANPGQGIGPLQFVLDPVASGAAGSLVDIAMKPQGKVKRGLAMVGLAEPATKEFANPAQVEHDCRVEVNRLRSEREGVAAEHAPIEELRAKALLKARTLGRTSGIRVVVGKDGAVDLAFPERPLGVTTPGGTKLGTVDAAGLVCAMFPDLVEAAIDRSLSEQFDADAGMTSPEKKKRLREIDEQILAVERIEAAAGWQHARETGEPVRFRPDLDPRAILGLA